MQKMPVWKALPPAHFRPENMALPPPVKAPAAERATQRETEATPAPAEHMLITRGGIVKGRGVADEKPFSPRMKKQLRYTPLSLPPAHGQRVGLPARANLLRGPRWRRSSSIGLNDGEGRADWKPSRVSPPGGRCGADGKSSQVSPQGDWCGADGKSSR